MWTPEARKAAAAKRRLNAEEKRRLKVLADHGVTVGSGGSYGANSTMGRARVGGERYPVSHSGRHLGIVWQEDGIKGYHVYPRLTSVPTYRAHDPVSTHASLPEAAAALADYQRIHIPAELTTPIRRPAEKPPPKPKRWPSRTPIRGRKTEEDPYPHDLGYVKRVRGGKHAGTHRAYYWAYGEYGLHDREEYLGAFPTHGEAAKRIRRHHAYNSEEPTKVHHGRSEIGMVLRLGRTKYRAVYYGRRTRRVWTDIGSFPSRAGAEQAIIAHHLSPDPPIRRVEVLENWSTVR